MLKGEGQSTVFYYTYYLEDGRRAGEAQLHGNGFIWAVEVYRPFRGVGHGRRLMKQLLDAAYVRGYGSVELYVQMHNGTARRMYYDLGFKDMEISDKGIRMRKELVSERSL